MNPRQQKMLERQMLAATDPDRVASQDGRLDELHAMVTAICGHLEIDTAPMMAAGPGPEADASAEAEPPKARKGRAAKGKAPAAE